MGWRARALVILVGVAAVAGAQTATETPGPAQGYWIDPATKLMWTGQDNGKAIVWHAAANYCRNLRLAGYHDWRLGTLDELATLVDKSEAAPKRTGNGEVVQINLGHHVRGNLSLNGDPWSSNREKDRFGHPYGPGWFFNFTTSKPSYDLQLFRNTKYALCVRRNEK